MAYLPSAGTSAPLRNNVYSVVNKKETHYRLIVSLLQIGADIRYAMNACTFSLSDLELKVDCQVTRLVICIDFELALNAASHPQGCEDRPSEDGVFLPRLHDERH